MNDCPRGEIRDLLPDLLTGSLDESTRARVEGHVRACADCAAELALLRDARAVLSRGPAMDTARIAAAARKARPARRTGTSARTWRIAAIAAAILLMVAGAFWLDQVRTITGPRVARQPTPVQRHEQSPTPATRATPAPAPGRTEVAAQPPRQAPARATSPAAAAAAPAEVAVAIVTDGELGDTELEALLADIRSLDGLPDAEPSEDVLSLPAMDGEVQR